MASLSLDRIRSHLNHRHRIGLLKMMSCELWFASLYCHFRMMHLKCDFVSWCSLVFLVHYSMKQDALVRFVYDVANETVKLSKLMCLIHFCYFFHLFFDWHWIFAQNLIELMFFLQAFLVLDIWQLLNLMLEMTKLWSCFLKEHGQLF